MTTTEMTPKKKKTAVKTPPADQIRYLQDMVETNRIAAEGWREVAEKNKGIVSEQKRLIDEQTFKIDDQARLLDQQSGQIESLRRQVDDLNNLIYSTAGVPPKLRAART